MIFPSCFNICWFKILHMWFYLKKSKKKQKNPHNPRKTSSIVSNCNYKTKVCTFFVTWFLKYVLSYLIKLTAQTSVS